MSDFFISLGLINPLLFLKAGFKAARIGWRDKQQYIQQVLPSDISLSRDGLEVRGRDSRAHDHFPHDNRDDRRPPPRSVVPGRRGEGRSPRERDNEDRFGRGMEYRR